MSASRFAGNVSQLPVASVRTSLRSLAPTREQVATGRVLNRPSDSPVGTVVAMRLRAGLADQEQYVRNGRDGAAWLRRTASSLDSAQVCLRRARALQLPADGAATSAARRRELLAAQVARSREDLLRIANATRRGRPLFGGITPAARAYDRTGSFVGAAGPVDRVVGDGLSIRVDVDGPAAFGAPGADVFTELERLARAVHAEDETGTAAGIRGLDRAMARLRRRTAEVEATTRSIGAAVDRARDTIADLTRSLAELESIDLPRARAELQVRDIAHQAALAATARVAQPSLAAFLG